LNAFERERAAHKLTQVEIAQRMNVDQTSVSKWETGKCLPRPPVLLRLAALYGCTVDELLRGVDDGTAKGGVTQ
jgi:transcriptional regulator with XRE-family HTH domain